MSDRRSQNIAIARYVLGTADDAEAQLVESLGLSGPDLPTAENAAWTILELLVGEIAQGVVEPEPGLRRVIDEVFRSAGLMAEGRARGRMGDSHNAARLVRLQDEYEDIQRAERRSRSVDYRRAQVDAQTVTMARDWMRGNASGRLA
jgi:hypothetical protein